MQTIVLNAAHSTGVNTKVLAKRERESKRENKRKY